VWICGDFLIFVKRDLSFLKTIVEFLHKVGMRFLKERTGKEMKKTKLKINAQRCAIFSWDFFTEYVLGVALKGGKQRRRP